MKVALYNLEPDFVNAAMMQVSTYHKQKGDTVSKYGPIFHETYDKIYAFSVFDFTDKSTVTPDMIRGGSGFKDLLEKRLPAEIEACDYDWDLFPHCDYSIIWFSRGCIRNCPFCIVRQKEGIIHPVEHKNLNPNGEHIKVMDNNFFANPKWREAVEQLHEWGQPVDFQGVDVRIMTEEMANALKNFQHYRQVHIAWDNPKDDLVPKLEIITKYIRPSMLMCYVLIGYWSTPEEDLSRVETLRSFKIDPYVMPYNKFDPYQKMFRDYVNCKPIFKTQTWEEFKQSRKQRYNKGEAMKEKGQIKLGDIF